ncbi:OmpA family protein [Neolewinella aurantiaca]|uniref:OmpA family protein n=1 Tax=Neolewinella aurantiaca TaxID=2602767 RepID=A0A5C7FLZ7_9BACT|nr:OmpA family protein [Neolewinella aurantiaca]TXF91088.1 OmpA family protein [Neolewinella aurantiaca]
MKAFYYSILLLSFSFAAKAHTDTLYLTQSIYFASALDVPGPAEMDKLKTFANELKGYASYSLSVEAFTDEQGTDAYNEELAQRRALHCTRALAQVNVVPATTAISSYGEQRARQNTATDTERKKDRRVDLVATVVRWRNIGEAIASTNPKQVVANLNPTLPQSIEGKKGGLFEIAPNTLVREDGSPAVGPVSIELAEAYELTDILLAGLTTTSGGQRLETGGMINLTATDAEGHPLQLKPGAEISASIPTDYFNPDMKIFTGTDLNPDGVPTNWELTAGSVSLPKKPSSEILTFEEYLEKMGILLDRFIDFSLARRGGCDLVPDMRPKPCLDFYDWLYTYPGPDTPAYINFATYHVPPRPDPVDTNAIVYQPVGSEKLFMSKKQRQNITTQRRQRALKVYTRKLERHERSSAHKAQIPVRNDRLRKQYEEDMLVWREEATQRKQMALAGLTRHDYLLSEADRLVRIGKLKAAEEIKQRAIEGMEAEISAAEDLSGKSWAVERYVFTVNQLGWANCDMFTGETNLAPVAVRINYSSPSAKVMLLPVGRRSVIAYNRKKNGIWRNQGIPEALNYHIIAFEVLEGKMVLAHKFVSEANNELQEVDYKPVSVTELKRKMAELIESEAK